MDALCEIEHNGAGPPTAAVPNVKERRPNANGKAAKKPNQPAWPEPDWSLLDNRRGELPSFPADVLPEKWQTWLAKASRGAGVTSGHVMAPLLSIAPSLIGTARRVRASRSWSEPFSQWAALVGFSGAGKTPGIDVTKRALSLIAKNRQRDIGNLERAHEQRAETAKAASKKWKAEVQQAVEKNQRAPEMPREAMPVGEFVAPRLYASDATIERLAVLLQARPRGMAMVSDELAGLFANMGRYSNGSDREFWLEAWNGGHHVVERQGRPAVVLDHLLIGICGGFQPDKLATAFAGDDDGMYARMLFAWPEEPPFRGLTDDVAEVEPEFQTALMRLIDLPAGDGEIFVPRDISLSQNARAIFEQFRQFHHAGKAALDGREREWWAKGATHVLRLAGTLCYLDWAMRDADEPHAIADVFMAGAVRLWQAYFWPHARAALRQVGLSDKHANARRVLRWIKSGKAKSVSVKDVRRDALNQRIDAEQTENLLDSLEPSGWLRKTTEQKPGPGRPIHRWMVNPALISDAHAGNAANAGNGGEL